MKEPPAAGRSHPRMKALLLALCSASLCLAQSRPKVVAYVPNWIDLKEFSKTIDYHRLTHLNIAFENPADDTGILSFQTQNTALIRRAKAAGVKVLVSIGGGSVSENKAKRETYFRLLDDGRRAAFVNHIAAYIQRHGFDGLDVDLEGPAIQKNYGPFIADLAAALKPKGKLLTAALSEGYGGKQVPAAALARFDFINIMAYDATGPWDPARPGPHSSFAYAKRAITYWTGRGLPPQNLVLGLPFYGYGFGDSFRDYGYPYAELLTLYPEAYDKDKLGQTIWHNSSHTIRRKSQLALDRKLGGVMIWSLDQDARGAKSLLKVIHQTLRP
jgi:chitinase